MSVEIKPGPELDRTVAEIVGDPSPHDPFLKPWCDSPPRFSTDLNAAMEAAEKVFPGGTALCVYRNESVCNPVRCNEGPGLEVLKQIEARARTPALAVCAAILMLRETSDVSRSG